jgi:spoIIIJ-associated protein
MEDYIQFSAKTKSEAITKACIELGVSSDQLDIQVITEGSNGFFGIGSKPAIIKVRKVEPVSEEQEMKEIVETVKLDSFKEEVPVKEEKKPEPVKQEKKETKSVSEKPRQPKPAKEKAAKEKQPREPKKDYKESKQTREKAAKPVKPAKPVEIITDPVEIKEVENRAKEFLRDVFASMNLGEVEITSEYNTTDGSLEVDFEGEDMGILIGKRGQTLDSLQYLTSLVVNKGKSNYIRVKLDTEDYRKRRKETLENLARGIAYKVRKTRKPVILEPMNPYERRIIHSALQGNKFVETVSEGEEPYRHVVVKLKRN